MKRKYLFVGWYPNAVEKYKNVFFQNLVFALADAGHDCTVISPVSYMRYKHRIFRIADYTYQVTPGNNRVRVLYPKIFSASSKQIFSFNTEVITERLFEYGAVKAARKLKEKGENFDAVYGHFFLYGGLAAIQIGRLLNIPSFVAFGECDYESQIQLTYGGLKAKEIEGLSGVISVSTKNANKLNELGMFNDIPIIIAPNAVDHKLFKKLDKEECRKKLNIPKDKFVIGFVGGFIERKGDKRLLKAVEQLDNVFLAFAGVGNDPPCGDRVLFCQPLVHEDVPILLNAVDVFCMPTLSEGSCNAVAEALSCGVPVISSNLSFNDDVLNNNNSIRIDPNSVDDIRDAIKTLRDNQIYRKELSEAGYMTGQNLKIENRAALINDFMEQIIVRTK